MRYILATNHTNVFIHRGTHFLTELQNAILSLALKKINKCVSTRLYLVAICSFAKYIYKISSAVTEFTEFQPGNQE